MFDKIRYQHESFDYDLARFAYIDEIEMEALGVQPMDPDKFILVKMPDGTYQDLFPNDYDSQRLFEHARVFAMLNQEYNDKKFNTSGVTGLDHLVKDWYLMYGFTEDQSKHYYYSLRMLPCDLVTTVEIEEEKYMQELREYQESEKQLRGGLNVVP